ncbi:Nhl repeat-containing protein, partial [Thalictrum thalictroides]
MALRALAPFFITKSSPLFYPCSKKLQHHHPTFYFCNSSSSLQIISRQKRNNTYKCCSSNLKVEEQNISEKENMWGKVSAVLFDMDGVLCNSEELSRLAAVDVFAEMGVEVTSQDFVPFMGTGEANFLGGVASIKGVEGFNPEASKKRFFEIYLDK